MQQSSNNNAVTFSNFLISGVNTASTGSVYPVLGFNNFAFLAEAVQTGAINGFGTVNIEARLTDGGAWSNISRTSFTNSSGAGLLIYNAPIEALRASVSSYSSGAFNVSFCARG